MVLASAGDMSLEALAQLADKIIWYRLPHPKPWATPCPSVGVPHRGRPACHSRSWLSAPFPAPGRCHQSPAGWPPHPTTSQWCPYFNALSPAMCAPPTHREPLYGHPSRVPIPDLSTSQGCAHQTFSTAPHPHLWLPGACPSPLSASWASACCPSRVRSHVGAWDHPALFQPMGFPTAYGSQESTRWLASLRRLPCLEQRHRSGPVPHSPLAGFLFLTTWLHHLFEDWFG